MTPAAITTQRFPIEQDDKLLTYEQVSRLFNIPKNTLYAWVSEGRIPHIRLSARFVRFSEAGLRSWFSKNAVEATNDKR